MIWENAPGDVQRGAKKTEVEGLVKPVAARLMQLALPGQILLSGVAYDIAHRAQGELGELLDNVRWRTHGRYRFKGVPEPVPVFEVGEEGLAPLKPPPWTSKAHRETPIWRRPIAVALEVCARRGARRRAALLSDAPAARDRVRESRLGRRRRSQESDRRQRVRRFAAGRVPRRPRAVALHQRRARLCRCAVR